jgi:hypothetical protein
MEKGKKWVQMSKRSLNFWLKSLNKKFFSKILLNRISHLALPLERVLIKFNAVIAKGTYLPISVHVFQSKGKLLLN